MTTDYITITRADVLNLTSTRTDRITLPIKPQGDALFCAESLIAEATPATGYPNTDEGADQYAADCLRILDESEISATLTLIPHLRRVSATVDLTISMLNGQCFQRRYVCRIQDETAAEFIKDFFAAGASGLRNDFREYFRRRFDDYSSNTAA